jgi:hypothetical protein
MIRKGGLLSVCFLGVSALALATPGARAQFISGGSATAIVFDDPGTATQPDPDTGTCTPMGGACNAIASAAGAHTTATALTSVNELISSPFNTVTLLGPNAFLVTPLIQVVGAVEAVPSTNSSTSAGIAGTAVWTYGGTISPTPVGGLTAGKLIWLTTFTLVSAINSIFQIEFFVSSPDNPSYSLETTVSLTCTGTSCVSNLSTYTDFNHGIFLAFPLNSCNCTGLDVTEVVDWQADIQAGHAGIQTLSFLDPMTLTILDSNGNVVPNLFLFDSTSNTFMGLSGQDFSVAGVPEPSTWAMMLLGFAGLGVAFRQSRRKVPPAAEHPHVLAQTCMLRKSSGGSPTS